MSSLFLLKASSSETKRKIPYNRFTYPLEVSKICQDLQISASIQKFLPLSPMFVRFTPPCAAMFRYRSNMPRNYPRKRSDSKNIHSLNSSDYYTVNGVIQMVLQIPRLSTTVKNFPPNVQRDDNSRQLRIPPFRFHNDTSLTRMSASSVRRYNNSAWKRGVIKGTSNNVGYLVWHAHTRSTIRVTWTECCEIRTKRVARHVVARFIDERNMYNDIPNQR